MQEQSTEKTTCLRGTASKNPNVFNLTKELENTLLATENEIGAAPVLAQHVAQQPRKGSPVAEHGMRAGFSFQDLQEGRAEVWPPHAIPARNRSYEGPPVLPVDHRLPYAFQSYLYSRSWKSMSVSSALATPSSIQRHTGLGDQQTSSGSPNCKQSQAPRACASVVLSCARALSVPASHRRHCDELDIPCRP